MGPWLHRSDKSHIILDMFEHIDRHQQIGCVGLHCEVIGLMERQPVAGFRTGDCQRLRRNVIAIEPRSGKLLRQIDQNLARTAADFNDVLWIKRIALQDFCNPLRLVWRVFGVPIRVLFQIAATLIDRMTIRHGVTFLLTWLHPIAAQHLHCKRWRGLTWRRETLDARPDRQAPSLGCLAVIRPRQSVRGPLFAWGPA